MIVRTHKEGSQFINNVQYITFNMNYTKEEIIQEKDNFMKSYQNKFLPICTFIFSNKLL